jgi:hypothetical protein
MVLPQDSQRRCCTEGVMSRPSLAKGSIRGTQLFCPGKWKCKAGTEHQSDVDVPQPQGPPCWTLSWSSGSELQM